MTKSRMSKDILVALLPQTPMSATPGAPRQASVDRQTSVTVDSNYVATNVYGNFWLAFSVDGS